MYVSVGNVAMQVRHVHECVEVCCAGSAYIGQAGKQHAWCSAVCECACVYASRQWTDEDVNMQKRGR